MSAPELLDETDQAIRITDTGRAGMSTVTDFKIGDGVRHLTRSQEGQVISAERDGIRVRFNSGSLGIYDELWFRLHPDLLVNLSKNETLTERRRAGARIQRERVT